MLARHGTLYTYGARAPQVWWESMKNKVTRFSNLHIVHVDPDSEATLEPLMQRTMQLQCMIQDGQIWFGSTEQSMEMGLTTWFGASPHH